MARPKVAVVQAVSIDVGPDDWEVVQQDAAGVAELKLSGRWETIMKRKQPEVRVRVCREGSFTAVTRQHEWVKARTRVDRSVTGKHAGRCGTWSLTLPPLARGGPYRIDTSIDAHGSPIEWRRCGQGIHFLCVGDVWLIAGQSNAEGYGRDPVHDPSELGLHEFAQDGRWRLAAHDSRHHPWLAFARQLKDALGYPIGLIPTAVGGSAVSSWDPGQQGELFANMRDRVQDAGGQLRGCVWYQGESDVGDAEHPKYKQRFTRFVKGLRRCARSPALPVLTVQLMRVLGPRGDGANWEAMREIQRQLAHELEGVFVFPIFEAGLCDGIHISSLGNLLIAQRAAATALGGVYGHELHYRHPECVAARKRARTGIELRFANVVERLDYESTPGHGFPFAVRDEEGIVPVAGFALPRPNVFRIELARPLVGSATVTGAPGTCPPQIVPRDISGYRGMLAFTLPVS